VTKKIINDAQFREKELAFAWMIERGIADSYDES